MKARVKATGEIVEVSQGIYSPYQYVDDNGTIYTEEHLEILQEVLASTIDYWTRLEHQYVGLAMQGMLAGTYYQGLSHDRVVEDAQYIAHALVEKLKEEMKPKDNIIVQKCRMSCTFFKLMEKDGKASCTIWLDDTPTICDLYVNESDRCQGLATDMLKMCEDLVKAEGYPGVWLYTEEGSWLVDWYERKGYRKTGETLQVKGQTVMSLWMYKKL